MEKKVINNCKYSFQDLFTESNFEIDKNILYGMKQEDINKLVKQLCEKVNWGWEDKLGTDGIIYTAFSPEFI